MEFGRLRSAGNRNQAPIPIPIPMMPPGFPVTNGADDVNLLHQSVTLNPSITLPSENHHHLTNPNHLAEVLLDNNAAMREMIFRKAALQPINTDPAGSVKIPKRKNVRISKDPQSVAARHRRERVSERIRILQRMVPGGTRMDTGSMLDEAVRYVKFLKRQVKCLEKVRPVRDGRGYGGGIGLGLGFDGPGAAEEVWGYNDYMASCMEMGDVLCKQGQISSGESYGDF